MNDHREHESRAFGATQGQMPSQESDASRSYQTPTLRSYGEVSQLTLGSAGSTNDATKMRMQG